MDSELDRALFHAIMCIGAEDNHDRLELGDYPGAWREDYDNEETEELAEWQSSFLAELAAEEFDDIDDIDLPRQIPGVTLNGGPVFEDDFET
jgi:hypothetical protein